MKFAVYTGNLPESKVLQVSLDPLIQVCRGI